MPRQPDPQTVSKQRTDPPSYLEQFASYEDGDQLVVCDTKSPNSWIRSDVTVAIQS